MEAKASGLNESPHPKVGKSRSQMVKARQCAPSLNESPHPKVGKSCMMWV